MIGVETDHHGNGTNDNKDCITNHSLVSSWVEKPARTAAAVDTNALQIVALTEKLISTSFRESVLSVLQHLKFDSKVK